MSYELTKNFEKELQMFFSWVTRYYIVENDLNEIVNWNKELLSEFNETPRKKLDGFLKHVFKIYIIKNKESNVVIDSYTDIVTQFKNIKDDFKNNDDFKSDKLICETKKKKSKLIKTKSISKNNRGDDYDEDLYDDDNDDGNYNVYEVSLDDLNIHSFVSNNTIEIVIDDSLNTKGTWWLTNLAYDTDALINVLGQPILTGKPNDKHRYEWKFKFNNYIYSIYDWRFNNDDFCDLNDSLWFLGGNSEKCTDILLNVLESKINVN